HLLLPPQVFLAGQHPQAFAGTLLYFGGVGAKERWCIGDELSIDDGEIHRYVVSLDPPAPCFFRARFSEDEEVIELGVARELAPSAFQFMKDRLEAHNVRRF